MISPREVAPLSRLLRHTVRNAGLRYSYKGLVSPLRCQHSMGAGYSSESKIEETRILPEDHLSGGVVNQGMINEIIKEALTEGKKTTTEAASPTKAVKQCFDYLVVIDFEATCDSAVFFPQEIIEFPSVLVAIDSLTVEDSFQTYVKPTFNPQLTEFCKNLTGIRQTQVDSGIALADALDKHDKWLEEKGIKEKRFGVATWTDWDCKVMLDFECRLKGLKKPPYFDKWINLKSLFHNEFKQSSNLKRAVLRAGLKWEGREHCGLDDAKNTASLAMELIRRGVLLSYSDPHATKKAATMRIDEDFMPKLKKILASLPKSSDAEETTVLAAASKNVCFCGVKCKTRVVRTAGPNKGKIFLSCGNWTLTGGGKCTYFEWSSAAAAAESGSS